MMLWFAACTFEAGSEVILDSGEDSGTIPSGEDSTSPTNPTETATTTLGPSDVDDDLDGWTENEGDCDDADEDVHPEVEDDCDGVDEDCDGEVDEDATTADAYEPNDEAPYDLGSLEEESSRSLSAVLLNDDDVDRFQFSIVDDTLDFFTVEATLSNIPADATFRFTLNRLRSDGDLETGEIDQVFGTSSLSLSYGDTDWSDDGGDYELVIEAIAGADCGRSYLLELGQ